MPRTAGSTSPATRDNPVSTNLYRRQAGRPDRAAHAGAPEATRATMSPDGELFPVELVRHPARRAASRLYAADGRLVRTLDSNPSHEIKRLRFGPRERFKIPTKDGFLLEAELILPPDLDTEQEVPGLVHDLRRAACADGLGLLGGRPDVRSGPGQRGVRRLPHGPAHRQRQGGGLGLDGLQAPGRPGARRHQDAINWLKQKPYVDGSRIGMAGHSYGGYITSYAMTHSDLFAAGIAGAPVTDWRDYDSIYTERYMGLPQDNPEGYNVSSVVRAAGKLHGKLLILHGVIDDNVSLRNTMRLVEALQDANKDFELMIYPSSRHGIFGPHYTQAPARLHPAHAGRPEAAKTGLAR